jgi:lysophospholipase L1-like esterase
MRAAGSSESRFDRLPVWQRSGVLALTVLAICAVLLLLAEAGVRIQAKIERGGFWGIEQTYTLDPASGLRIPVPGGHFGPIVINSFGFRSPEISEDKPPGRLRIAFLGGSTTYCAEVSSNEMTWPHLVWKALHERWPGLDLDYINAGVPGYTTPSLLQALEKRVARFKPDVIVIYEATNDLSFNSGRLAREQGLTHAVLPEVDDLNWLTRHSRLALLIQKNLQIIRQQRLADDAPGKLRLDTPWLDAEFRRDYTNLVEASEKVARIVVTVTFAHRLRGEQTREQQAALSTALYYMPYMTIDDFLTGFSHYNQVIREVAGSHHALLVGGEDTIPADDKHFADYVHLTDAGSEAQARRVTAALISSSAFQALVLNTIAVKSASTSPH